jgi:DNA modification methylase
MSKWKANHLVEGDVLNSLKQVPSESAQLIIADPPYNLGPKFGNKKEWINDLDWQDWSRNWLEECQRILSEDGNLFVYGIHHYLCYTQVALYEMGMKYRRQIIWNYENGFSSSRNTLATHYEPVLWFSKSDNYFFKEIREPYKSTERLKHKIIKNGKEWTPNPAGRMAGDIWSFPTLAGRRFAEEKVKHPTQKPLSISRRIVNHFSEPGKLVVVPFVGSGSECVAAKELSRNYWGCEINQDYLKIANERIEKVNLFY